MRELFIMAEIRLSIFRHNPTDPLSEPHIDEFLVEDGLGMTLYTALNKLRDESDPTLAFDFVCRAGVCGSCAMVINGRPGLACRTLLTDAGPRITLLPLPGFELIADLSINTGKWMRALSEKLETWVHSKNEADIDKLETPVEPDVAEAVYELDRCIECGCCVAACGTAQMKDDFVGAIGINKMARFRADPNDARSDADFYELIGTDQGVFGCMTLLGCQDVCPKDLDLQTQLAYVRRKMALTGLIARA
jgi:fumarate reductase iron-sulfur subunit